MTTTDLDSAACGIERFPHVHKRLGMIWGSPECDFYLNKLLTDTRDGQRKGFPVEVTAELLFLVELNKMVRAIDAARRLKIPLRDAYRKIDMQDRGESESEHANPFVTRDQFARQEKEFGAGARPARREKKEGLTVRLGQGVFAVMSSKVLLFLVLLFVAYKLLTAYVFN